MERSPPWGDAFCLHKHGNWESRAAEARTSGSSKTAAATAEQQTEADNPLPCAREASGTLVTDRGSAGDGPCVLSPPCSPGGEDSALQRSRERAEAQGLGGCYAMDAPDSTPGRAHWGAGPLSCRVRRRGLPGVRGWGPSKNCGKENHLGQGHWGERGKGQSLV